MRFFTENIVDGDVSFNSGAAASGYDIDSLLNTNYSDVLYTSGASCSIDIDLSVARNCNYIAIGNLYYDGTISLLYGAADNGSDFDIYAFSAYDPTDYDPDYQRNLVKILSTSATKRYWRLTFNSWTTDNFLGIIFMGTYYDLPKNESYNFSRYYQENNQYDTMICLRKNWVQRRKVNYDGVNVMGLSEANMLEILNEFHDNCNEMEYPFFFKGDVSGSGSTAGIDSLEKYHYSKFINRKLSFKILNDDYYSLNFNLVGQL